MDRMQLQDSSFPLNPQAVNVSMESMPVKQPNKPIVNKFVDKKSTMKLQDKLPQMN